MEIKKRYRKGNEQSSVISAAYPDEKNLQIVCRLAILVVSPQ